MVRLKVAGLGKGIKGVKEFQFQNGAIKSIFPVGNFPTLIRFQFQNGAIKRNKKIQCSGFKMPFQFQNGAIKRKKVWNDRGIL